MSNAGIEFHLDYNGIFGWVILTQSVVGRNHPPWSEREKRSRRGSECVWTDKEEIRR